MEGGLIEYLKSMESPNVEALTSGNPLSLHDILLEMKDTVFGDSSIDPLVSVAIDLGIFPNDTSETLTCINKWKMFIGEDDLESFDMLIDIFKATEGEITNADFFKVTLISSETSDKLSTSIDILCSILICITNDNEPGGIDQTEEELNAQLESLSNLM